MDRGLPPGQTIGFQTVNVGFRKIRFGFRLTFLYTLTLTVKIPYKPWIAALNPDNDQLSTKIRSLEFLRHLACMIFCCLSIFI